MQNTKEFYDAFSAAITQQADPFHMPVIAPPPSAEAPQPPLAPAPAGKRAWNQV